MTIAEKMRQATDKELAQLLLRMHYALLTATVEEAVVLDEAVMEEVLKTRYEEETANAKS